MVINRYLGMALAVLLTGCAETPVERQNRLVANRLQEQDDDSTGKRMLMLFVLDRLKFGVDIYVILSVGAANRPIKGGPATGCCVSISA